MAFDEVTSQMPLGVEVGMSAAIPGLPVPVRGVIDLVQYDLTAVDNKSAAVKPDAGHAAFDHELQLVTYPGDIVCRENYVRCEYMEQR